MKIVNELKSMDVWFYKKLDNNCYNKLKLDGFWLVNLFDF